MKKPGGFQILIIEDNDQAIEFFKEVAEDLSIQVIIAADQETALRYVHEQFDVVAFDGNVPLKPCGSAGWELNTAELVQKFKAGHKIAISTSPISQRELRKAGCDEECQKYELFDFMKKKMLI